MGNNLWTCASVVLMTVGGCLAIGETIGHEIGTIIHGGSANGPIGGAGDGKSIEDPPLFIPAKPFNPLPGWCCGTGPHNTSTIERYLVNSTVYHTITKAAVKSAVALPCPSIFYPDRPKPKDCFIYEQRTYSVAKEISTRHHRTVTREEACKDNVLVCCPNFFSYHGNCVTQADCDQYNKMRELQGLPADCGV